MNTGKGSESFREDGERDARKGEGTVFLHHLQKLYHQGVEPIMLRNADDLSRLRSYPLLCFVILRPLCIYPFTTPSMNLPIVREQPML